MSFDERRASDSDEHVDELVEPVTNMDVTIIEDGDEPINYNEIAEYTSQDFNLAATLTLKKNLNEAFEKHAGEERKVGVKAKIQAFEEVNRENKQDHHLSKVKVTFETAPSRPPPVPVSKLGKADTGDGSRLSVYLRVRPPTASKVALEQGNEVLQNTIEIISSKESKDTLIRTYPPVQSHASKMIRASNHSLHHTKSDATAVECAVKGVKEFEFNQVFGPESSQKDVYESTAVPLLDGLFPKADVKIVGDNTVGQSALLFTYGITNSGKTFTVMGRENGKDVTRLHKYHGVIPRAIDHLLRNIDNLNNSVKNDVKYSLNMSFLEIYNEEIYDLSPKNISAINSKYARCVGSFDLDNKLQLRDLRNGNIHVKGLSKHRVTTLAQGLQLIIDAKKKRHTSSNNINTDSSRSHFVCQLELLASQSLGKSEDHASVCSEVSGYTTNDDDSVVSMSVKPRSVRFWVVDLAGSERSKRTGTFSRSARQKEASLINSSLMNLMTCLRTLKNNQSSNSIRSKVPFRDSKLTHMFMGHLTGSAASRTSMIVNVNPSVADFDETQHVLCYAVDAKSVRIDKGEYNKKRHEIQEKALHTHGQDGRPVKKRSKSPPRKIAKLAKKLSPRAILKRRREQQVLAQKRVKVKSSCESNPVVHKEKQEHRLAGSKRKLEDKMKELQEELENERLKVSQYLNDVANLKHKLERCETEIRQELAEETEAQIDFTRRQHDDIVKRLKQQLQNNSKTPSKSAKKAKIDRADQIIDDLMDKVEEQEEELSRMRDECSKMTQEHISELEQMKHVAENLKQKHAEEIARYQENISILESSMRGEYKEEETEGTLSLDEEGDKENSISRKASCKGTPSKSGLQRLPRGRCSEVACANISPPRENPLSSNKKQRGMRLRPKHSPFKTLSANKKHSRSGSNVQDIIFPDAELSRDNEGLFQRPRGRAPQGRSWDAVAGGWKLSILQS